MTRRWMIHLKPGYHTALLLPAHVMNVTPWWQWQVNRLMESLSTILSRCVRLMSCKSRVVSPRASCNDVPRQLELVGRSTRSPKRHQTSLILVPCRPPDPTQPGVGIIRSSQHQRENAWESHSTPDLPGASRRPALQKRGKATGSIVRASKAHSEETETGCS